MAEPSMRMGVQWGGAVVSVGDPDSLAFLQTHSDENGEFSFSNAPSVPFIIHGEHPAFGRVSLHVQAPSRSILTLVLSGRRSISGQIVGGDRPSFQGWSIEVLVRDGSEDRTISLGHWDANEAGKFTVQIPSDPSFLRVAVRPPGKYRGFSLCAQEVLNYELPVVISVPVPQWCSGELRGLVAAITDEAVTSGLLLLRVEDGESETVMPDSERGRFSFTGLCPGTYRLSIHRGEFSVVVADVLVGSGEILDLGIIPASRIGRLMVRFSGMVADSGMHILGADGRIVATQAFSSAPIQIDLGEGRYELVWRCTTGIEDRRHIEVLAGKVIAIDL